ncbi:hypothetical protein Tco_0696162 [Tanacetum coccineum]
MDLFAFIHTPDPTKVKVVERERKEGEPRLLETTVGHTVPLLPVVPDRGASELEASVDKMFDEYGSRNQTERGDSAGGGEPKRQRKRKTMAVDAGESSHPPKKLREDHGTPSGTSVGGKSRSSLQWLLAGAVLNAEVRGEVVPTLPFVTSSVSATLEREGEDHTDSVTGHNLRTIGAPQRFVISSDSSHHSGANVAEAEVDSLARPSLFAADSSSAGGADPNAGVFSDLTGSDFLVSGVRTVIDPDTDFQKVYVPSMEHDQMGHRLMPWIWIAVPELTLKRMRRLKVVVCRGKISYWKARDEEIVNLKAQMLLKEAEATEAIRLRAEASTFEAIEKSLRDEVNVLKERNTILKKERNALDVKATGLEASAMDKDCELVNLNAQLTSVKSQNDNLAHQVHELEVSSAGLQEKLSSYENLTKRLEEFQDDRMREVNDKFDKLYADFIEMALHLEERFYPHLLTTISVRRWLLTHGMELAISKCLNSTEYLSALGVAIGKAVEKGMQDGLSAGITHGTEGRALTDVAAYNPSAEALDTLMNILRLDDTLAERLGLIESQPHVDQLMVPIHHSPDQVVVGASALSLALDVSSSHVRKIKENIANYRSALRDVFVPLAEPLYFTAITGTEGTSDAVPVTADITTALSTTFVSASTVTPISVYDYEVTSTDDQTTANENVADGNANHFPL